MLNLVYMLYSTNRRYNIALVLTVLTLPISMLIVAFLTNNYFSIKLYEIIAVPLVLCIHIKIIQRLSFLILIYKTSNCITQYFQIKWLLEECFPYISIAVNIYLVKNFINTIIPTSEFIKISEYFLHLKHLLIFNFSFLLLLGILDVLNNWKYENMQNIKYYVKYKNWLNSIQNLFTVFILISWIFITLSIILLFKWSLWLLLINIIIIVLGLYVQNDTSFSENQRIFSIELTIAIIFLTFVLAIPELVDINDKYWGLMAMYERTIPLIKNLIGAFR